ncbi:MAG: hypothetical protein ACYS80_27375 [Planctomycetota bacterium]
MKGIWESRIIYALWMITDETVKALDNDNLSATVSEGESIRKGLGHGDSEIHTSSVSSNVCGIVGD